MKKQLQGLIGGDFIKSKRHTVGKGTDKTHHYTWEVIDFEYHETLLKARMANTERVDEEYEERQRQAFQEILRQEQEEEEKKAGDSQSDKGNNFYDDVEYPLNILEIDKLCDDVKDMKLKQEVSPFEILF